MQSIILASLLASAVTANSFMAHPLMKRDLLAPRATDAASPTDAAGLVDGLSGECQSAILDVYKTLPTPPPAVVSDLMENPQTDPCDFTVPSSLSKDYASYSSKIVSWYGEYEGEISSAIKECPELAQYASALPVCASDVIGKPSEAAATATGSETKSVVPIIATTAEKPVKTPGAGESAATTPTSGAGPVETNGAAREGAFVYAAAAVAGVVVAAL
ncbi:Ff.00g061820.m01.CDS01 [Fusarium sp. VM40]|nr:Ff.00g061820.m01.CDS01 [Fusarium sp. VM40]